MLIRSQMENSLAVLEADFSLVYGEPSAGAQRGLFHDVE